MISHLLTDNVYSRMNAIISCEEYFSKYERSPRQFGSVGRSAGEASLTC